MKIGGQFKRIILCVAAVVMLCCMYCVGVKADDSIILGMDQYRTEKGKVIIYVNHNKGESFNINNDDSCVVVGKQNLKIEKIQKFKDVNEPVSYMFMVDISGSMSKDRIDAVKTTLKDFIGTMKKGDNAAISTMADNLVGTEFTEDAATLSAFVDSIAVTNQDTDLYKSIKEELNTLKTDKAVNRKRCLVIFSDGAEDQKGGITKTEAENMVKDTHIPVFTVALLPKNYQKKDEESAKILGSFARDSAGGQHYVPALDKIECKDVNGKIKKAIEDSLVVSADLAEVTAQDGNIYLGVELSEGKEKGKSGMEVPVGDILDAIKEAKSVNVNVNINKNEKETAATKATPEAPKETAAKDTSKSKKLDKKMYFIIGGAAAAVLIIIIVLVLVLTSQKKGQPAPVSGGGSMAPSGGGGGSRTIGVASSAPQAPPAAASAPPADSSPSSGVKVTLYKMGPNASESYPLTLDTKKSIGRKATCDLSLSGDDALSGVHCYIFSKGKKIYIQDNNSTNGTFVNGVPITGEFGVESGDTLLIGAAEYKIVQE